MSDFGRVLEAAGWLASDAMNGVWIRRISDKVAYFAARFPCEDRYELSKSTKGEPKEQVIGVFGQEQILRIVAAIEGELEWRTDGPPIDEVVDVMWDTPGLGMIQTQALTRDGRVFKKPHPMNGFTMVCRVKEAVWRPYNPANWEVGE